MDLDQGLSPRHRLPLRLPGAWPACAQGLLREGAFWLHQGSPGGWGGDLLVLPGGPTLEARWDGEGFQTSEGASPWQALQNRVKSSPHPWVGAASFELACAEGALPFQAPAVGTLGMYWRGASEALYVAQGKVELWGWAEQPPSTPQVEAQLGGACALSRPDYGELRPGWNQDTHHDAVERIRRRIHDGDFYVANLCVPFRAAFQGDAVTFALARFKKARPPFGALLPLPDATLVSLSMEQLLAKDGCRLWTQPIKGSVPFTGVPETDEPAGQALAEDPKERAEHTMIVDLLRNDLGRVARSGSVQVTALMERLTFATVQHLVSRVEADLAPQVGLADLLRAVLPGGSVTGAPKRAVCGHLAAAEAGPRGFYCGAIGWIGPYGRCLDLALPIRTAQLATDQLLYWAGGGITRRSDPAREWDELLLKTRVMAK